MDVGSCVMDMYLWNRAYARWFWGPELALSVGILILGIEQVFGNVQISVASLCGIWAVPERQVERRFSGP